jgi:hypothetical protein
MMMGFMRFTMLLCHPYLLRGALSIGLGSAMLPLYTFYLLQA